MKRSKLIACNTRSLREKKLTPDAYRRVAQDMKRLKLERRKTEQIIQRGDAALVAFARGLLESRNQARAEGKLLRTKWSFKNNKSKKSTWLKLAGQKQKTNERMGQAVEAWATAVVEFHELRRRS